MIENRTLKNVVEMIYKMKSEFLGSQNVNTLLFCQKRREVDAFSVRIRHLNPTKENNFDGIFQIHSDFRQNDRNRILKMFQTGNGNNILICTSAMARGMDLPMVDLVIHLGSRQHSAEEYVHRIGF